jgi:hypothetical protein
MKLGHPMFNTLGWRHRFRLKPYTSLVNTDTTFHPEGSDSESTSVIDSPISTKGSPAESVHTTSSNTGSMAYTTDSVKPVSKDFAYPDSPKADSLSVWSDAAGEPLINDSKSDVIPRSVRPLDLKSLEAHVEQNQIRSSFQDPSLDNPTVDIQEISTDRPRTPDSVVRKSPIATKYVSY